MQKNIFKFIALFVAFVCVFYFIKKVQTNSTNSTSKGSELVEIYDSSLPDDFRTFYDQFHTDTSFQLSRIIFPLKGIAQSKDTTRIAEEVFWNKQDWKLHKPFNSNEGTFERTFTNLGGIVSEQISANEGLFTLEKRYAKLDDEWHLIYYQELLMTN